VTQEPSDESDHDVVTPQTLNPSEGNPVFKRSLGVLPAVIRLYRLSAQPLPADDRKLHATMVL
jgi:hypothetical protein